MANPTAKSKSNRRSPLMQWLERAIGLNGVRIRIRLQGNNLHVLCEGNPCPDATMVTTSLLRSLQDEDLTAVLPESWPTLYQILLYGRKLQAKGTAWTERIHLSQLDRYLAHLHEVSGEEQTNHLAEDGAEVVGIDRATVVSQSDINRPEESIQSDTDDLAEALQTSAATTQLDNTQLDNEASEAPESSLPYTAIAPDSEFDRSSDVTPNQESAPLSAEANPQANSADEGLSPEPVETATELTSQAQAATDTNREQSSVSEISTAAIVLSNRSLAKQGQTDAIARYLSETLSDLGIAVDAAARAIPYVADAAEADLKPPYTPSDSADNAAVGSQITDPPMSRRLWVVCRAPYSPDPLLIAEPVAAKLRDLELSQFKDAAILCQVHGETQPDWVLRVDLTPPGEMLREWARWGDVEAIVRLLNQALAEQDLTVSATLKDVTLHLVCEQKTATTDTGNQEKASPIPNKQRAMAAITPLLMTLAPQGILAASIYGQVVGQTTPAWLEWLDLPASEHAPLMESALELAQQGDRSALAFLLVRLLNPDLDWRLATGGVRIQLRQKHDLLHIMADAPVCPKQGDVGRAVARCLRELRLPRISGVRIYGRRAGQKRPLWSYGFDFVPRSNRIVPEAVPEFAASDAYVGDLVTQTTGGALARLEDIEALNATESSAEPENFRHALTQVAQEAYHTFYRLLLRSQLFVPSDRVPAPSSRMLAVKVGLVWSAVGLLMVLQIDWAIGQVLSRRNEETATVTDVLPSNGDVSWIESETETPQTDWDSVEPDTDAQLTDGDLPQSHPFHQSTQAENNGFNTSGFTQPGTDAIVVEDDLRDPGPNLESQSGKPLPRGPRRTSAAATARLAAARSRYPSFNSGLLDEKFALYRKRLGESGPPDVLIVGSSRALRGVDPSVLQKSLAAQGYEDLDIFNFGINGATAQVVDLLLRQFLLPDELPKLILWADGARAFNSGRLDITYNGVVASEGYKQLSEEMVQHQADAAQANPNAANAAESANSNPKQKPGDTNLVADSYRRFNHWLEDAVATLSATYDRRDDLKALLQGAWAGVFPDPDAWQSDRLASNEAGLLGEDNLEASSRSIDFNGFLPISERFNIATYYKNHPQVPGAYDADYEAFRIEGKQTEAMQNLLQFLKVKEIPLVFINLPLTQDYLDATRADYEEEFQRFMLEAAIRNQFIFRNLSDLWLTEHDYFSDPSHLNQYGAYAVSQHVAKDPMISWPQPQ